MTILPASVGQWYWKVLSSYKVNKACTWIQGALSPCKNPRIVWVFGCQRSGTTMLRNFIGFDSRVNDQGEGDPPFFRQLPVEDLQYLRLHPDEEVARLLAAQRSQVVLLKPLHDSQRAAALLNTFPGSKGIWIFRHYREVILSHLTYYKGRYEAFPYLRDLFELNEQSWKAEGLGEEMRSYILENKGLATTPTAAFALFWLARNSLLFDQEHPDLMTVNYNSLVEQPGKSLELLGKHIQLDLNDAYARFPQRFDRERPLPDPIPAPILDACEKMWERLKKRSAI
ncbi:hypothetical protein [Prosthecobacter sp.]|uniref:hypothetical protein n=1 Tax=Prosthecobacter sp. TaxID=1965333 RepID=UPI00378427BE